MLTLTFTGRKQSCNKSLDQKARTPVYNLMVKKTFNSWNMPHTEK